VGAGAVGRLLACLLSLGGARVTLYARDEAKRRALEQQGLRLEGPEGVKTASVKLARGPEELAEAGFVILATKAHQLEGALQELRPVLARGPCLVLVQNGMGFQERVAQSVGPERLVVASLYIGAQLRDEGSVLYAGGSDVELAALAPSARGRLEEASRLFAAGGLRVRIRQDWRAMLWEKLIVNSAINPITALSGLSNGEVLQVPSLARLLVRVAHESYRVALAEGIGPSFTDPAAKVLEACRSTASNRSSMLQDLQAGRRTEVDFINGYIVEKAQERGVEAPLNLALYALVKGRERALGVG